MNLVHLIGRGWRERPGRAVLSLVSVAIAVAAVLGTALAQSSVRLGVKKLTASLDEHPALEIVSTSGERLEAAEVPAVASVPGVVAAIPVVSRATLARVHGKRFRSVMLGLPVGDEQVWQALPVVSGAPCRREGEVLLSERLAKSLKAGVGDRLIVITRRGPRSAEIVGLADAELMDEFAAGAGIAMPLESVQQAFGLAGKIDRIRVLVPSLDARDGVLAAIAERLPDTLLVQTPTSPTETIDSTLRSTELALRLAGALSMAMAAFIILNTLRLNFSERRRDMAVIRVLGATEKQVLRLHLLEGVGLGALGAVLGLPLGLWLGRALRETMSQILGVEIAAPEMPWGVLAVALALGPMVAALAALVPALQARRVSPVEALGDLELRAGERFPAWATAAGVAAWCLSVALVVLVMQERLVPEAAIPAGLLMLVAFIAILPAVVVPIVRAAVWLLAPWLKTEGELAGEQLLVRSTRTGLTAGVLVVALSAGLGLGTAIVNNVEDMRNWWRRTLSGDIFITDPVAEDETAASQDRDLRSKITSQPEVAHVVEIRLVPVRADGLPALCMVREFVPEIPLPWTLPAEVEADVRRRLKSGETVISTVLARKLNLAAGDTLRLEVHGRVLPVRIAALVNDYMQGGLVAFLDRDAAARSISLAPAEFFMVWARPGADVDALSAALGQRLADEGVVLQSFLELRRRLDVLVDAVVGALWSLLALGFLVGAAAVSNTLTLNVLEQTRELGLLRIIGMTPRQVRRLVFCEALLLGLLGALLGTAGGITTAVLIHWCNEPVVGRSIPFALPGWLLAANVGGCLAIALAAAWRPARRAARLNALTAIAYE
jgi:putative ABC transport system permease protein